MILLLLDVFDRYKQSDFADQSDSDVLKTLCVHHHPFIYLLFLNDLVSSHLKELKTDPLLLNLLECEFNVLKWYQPEIEESTLDTSGSILKEVSLPSIPSWVQSLLRLTWGRVCLAQGEFDKGIDVLSIGKHLNEQSFLSYLYLAQGHIEHAFNQIELAFQNLSSTSIRLKLNTAENTLACLPYFASGHLHHLTLCETRLRKRFNETLLEDLGVFECIRSLQKKHH